jgi:hypothetical protein
MENVIDIRKVQKAKKGPLMNDLEGFTPCSQDMTICGDCEGNRARKKCPRLREWLSKRQRRAGSGGTT